MTNRQSLQQAEQRLVKARRRLIDARKSNDAMDKIDAMLAVRSAMAGAQRIIDEAERTDSEWGALVKAGRREIYGPSRAARYGDFRVERR